MKDLLNYLEQQGYQGISAIKDEDEDAISHIYFEDRQLFYCAIAPHEGNGMHFLLRANAKANFDRWSIAAHQTYHNSIEQVIDMLEDSQIEVYENCIADLARDYKILDEDNDLLYNKYINLKYKSEDED